MRMTDSFPFISLNINQSPLPGEDGWGHTVSNYTQITDLLNRLLCTFIGWDPTTTFNHPTSWSASTLFERKWRHSTKTCHKYTENRWGPKIFQMCFDLELDIVQPLFQKALRQKQSGHKTAFGATLWNMSAGHKETPRDTTCQTGPVVFFSNPLMSGESLLAAWAHTAAGVYLRLIQKPSPCHSNPYLCYLKTIVFVCLYLDVESDWSPIHDAAFNGRVLALKRLIAQVNFNGIF